MDEPLFRISNIWSPLCPKHICRDAQQVTDSGSLECQILKHFCMFIQFIFIHITICQHVFNNRCSVFFYWSTEDLSVWLEVWICLFQFSLKAHKPPQEFGHGGAQRPDLSRLIEAPWCLLCSVSPHCAVAILYPDIFYMSHTNPTTIML